MKLNVFKYRMFKHQLFKTAFMLSLKMFNSTKRLKTRFNFSEPSSGTSSRTDCRVLPEVKVDFSTNLQTTSAGPDSQTRNIRYIFFLLLFWPLLLYLLLFCSMLLLFWPLLLNLLLFWLFLLFQRCRYCCCS